MKAISKELFIMALLIMIVVFVVGMIFYDYMPNNKTVPEPITYTAESSTTAVLQEIAATTTATDDGSSPDASIESQSIIKSYSIGAKELNSAAEKQTYTSGKTDPFAEYVETSSNSTNKGNTTNTTNTTAGTSSNKDSSSKTNSTGTFFEKPNKK